MQNSYSIHESWNEIINPEFDNPYFKSLINFLEAEEKKGHTIFPAKPNLFSAFNLTPFDKVKVVLIGQDPYHNYDQANGLCFSVNKGISLPPSLKNIFKELESDLQIVPPLSGDLSIWAAQGILLMNAVLTVEANKPASHQNLGWEIFTDFIIKNLSDKKSDLVFLLWGNFAKSKKKLIQSQKHLILEAAHPSPLSAYKGFFGCQHFSKLNTYLKSKGIGEINWDLSS